MVEAVGERYWPAYLDCLARNLKPGGKAALQFISIDHRLFDRYAASADFIQAYIFPGGMLIDEPRFEALASERGLSLGGPRRLRPRLCRDAAPLARALRRRGRRRHARRLRRGVPRSVALLSDVLRRRLPRRRHRRRAGDASGDLMCVLVSSINALTMLAFWSTSARIDGGRRIRSRSADARVDWRIARRMFARAISSQDAQRAVQRSCRHLPRSVGR